MRKAHRNEFQFLPSSPAPFIVETHEAIPNKIKWDIDELVLKVNDLLRPASFSQNTQMMTVKWTESDIILN